MSAALFPLLSVCEIKRWYVGACVCDFCSICEIKKGVWGHGEIDRE